MLLSVWLLMTTIATGAAGGVGVAAALVSGVVVGGVDVGGACCVGLLRFVGVLRLVVWAKVTDEMAKKSISDKTSNGAFVVTNTDFIWKGSERVIGNSWLAKY